MADTFQYLKGMWTRDWSQRRPSREQLSLASEALALTHVGAIREYCSFFQKRQPRPVRFQFPLHPRDTLAEKRQRLGWGALARLGDLLFHQSTFPPKPPLSSSPHFLPIQVVTAK